MKILDFLEIPGITEPIRLDDITWVGIWEKRIVIHWDDGVPDCMHLLRMSFTPDLILNATEDDHYPFLHLTESDFEKYAVALNKLIKINVIDPLK